MQQIASVMQGLLPVLMIVGLGIFLRYRKILTETVEHGMMQLVVQVFMPALTLANIIGNEALENFTNVAIFAGFGFTMLLVGCLISYALGGLFGMTRGNGKRTFAVATGIQNFGFMGVPLMMSVFPQGDLLGILFIHNMGVEVAVWTVGISLMMGDKTLHWKIFMRAPILAVVVGLLINALAIDHWFTGTPIQTLKFLGLAAIPIALLVIGGGLVELLRKEKFQWNIAIGSILARLMIIPAIMLLTAYLLPIPDALRKVVIIQAAMPTAMIPIILARHYGGKPAIAMQVVVATTIACFFTMPFIIILGMRLFGFQ